MAFAGRFPALTIALLLVSEAVGVAHGPLAENEKQDMMHELDAMVAYLYGLDEAQLIHIFETGWNYRRRRDGALRHFRAWGKR